MAVRLSTGLTEAVSASQLRSSFAQEHQAPKESDDFKTSKSAPRATKRTYVPLDANALREIAHANYKLGEMHYRGEAVEPDHRAARTFFEKAATQGNAGAQFRLGVMAFAGSIDRKPDDALALEQNKKAADQGHAGAQFLLAKQIYEGRGVEANCLLAKAWMEKAAVQGHPTAQRSLGDLYASGGIGLERNYVEARRWYELAAAQGDGPSQLSLAGFYHNGLGVEKNMNVFHQWLAKASTHENNNSVLLHVADWYSSTSVGQYAKALEIYQKLTQKGVRQAYTGIENIYRIWSSWDLRGATLKKHQAAVDIATQTSLGISQLQEGNYQTALKTLEKTAAKGNAIAQMTLGQMFLEGWGAKKNPKTARDWLTKAATQGYASAQYDLAVMNEQGLGGEKSYVVALQLYKAAAGSGLMISIDAAFKVGRMYEQGLGVERSETEARKWFKKAANEGDTYAAEALARLTPECEEQPEPSAPPLDLLSSPKPTENAPNQALCSFDPNVFLAAQEKVYTDRLLSLQFSLVEGQKALEKQRQEYSSLQTMITSADAEHAQQLKEKATILNALIKKGELEQQADEERRKISQDESLLGYYRAFQTFFNGIFTACQNLDSRMGGKVKSTLATQRVDAVADGVAFIKDEMIDAIPMVGGTLKKILQILSAPLSIYAHIERTKAVQYMAHFFTSPIQCNQCIEGLARNLALAQPAKIRSMRREPKGALKALAHNLKDMAHSRFDQNIPSELRDFAELQCQGVIVEIMKNKLKPDLELQRTLVNLAQVVMGPNFTPTACF